MAAISDDILLKLEAQTEKNLREIRAELRRRRIK